MRGDWYAWALFGWLAHSPAMAQACPEPLRAVSSRYGEAMHDAAESGVTQFITDSTTGFLRRAGIRHVVQVVPYARAVKELESGAASVLIVADPAVAHLRDQLVSVPLLRLQVARFDTASEAGVARSGMTGILRGFQAPPAAAVDGARLQHVATYDSMFRMLASGRVDSAIAVRPTADLYLQHHPDVARQVKLGRNLASILMSVHMSRRLPADCLNRLVDEASASGPSFVKEAFLVNLPGVRFEDFRLH
jgi:hypothetical protein